MKAASSEKQNSNDRVLNDAKISEQKKTMFPFPRRVQLRGGSVDWFGLPQKKVFNSHLLGVSSRTTLKNPEQIYQRDHESVRDSGLTIWEQPYLWMLT